MSDKGKRYWIITDPHLLHDKTVQYCNRPKDFTYRIHKGLSDIPAEDILICLGDISASALETEAHERFIKPLKCTKILVKGNHDKRSDTWYYRNGWDFVCLSFKNTYFGKNILFSHHPKPWDWYYDYNIFGHFHNIPCERWEPELKKYISDRHILLAIERTQYKPVNLNWIVSKANERINKDSNLKEYYKSFNQQKFYFALDILNGKVC